MADNSLGSGWVAPPRPHPPVPSLGPVQAVWLQSRVPIPEEQCAPPEAHCLEGTSKRGNLASVSVRGPLATRSVPRYALRILGGMTCVGGRLMSESQYRCPGCGSVETPKLVVRGSGQREAGVSHRCRSCGSEWADSHQQDSQVRVEFTGS